MKLVTTNFVFLQNTSEVQQRIQRSSSITTAITSGHLQNCTDIMEVQQLEEGNLFSPRTE